MHIAGLIWTNANKYKLLLSAHMKSHFRPHWVSVGTILRLLTAVLLALLSSGSMVKADPPGAGWTLSFSDEFNGQSTYDHGKWSPVYVHGAHTLSGNGELEWYVD